MTFNEFYQGVNGKSLDYDGLYGYQCVDLIKVYLDWCFEIKPGAWGNAKDYWNNLNKANMSDYFYKVPNTRDLVVQRGDIVVWGAMSGNPYGHIAIGLSGDINHFTSLDQNWGSNYVREIYHNYDRVLGVLRPKDQSKLLGVKSMSNLKGKYLTMDELRNLPDNTKVKVEGNFLIHNYPIVAVGAKVAQNRRGFRMNFDGWVETNTGLSLNLTNTDIFFDTPKYNTSFFTLVD